VFQFVVQTVHEIVAQQFGEGLSQTGVRHGADVDRDRLEQRLVQVPSGLSGGSPGKRRRRVARVPGRRRGCRRADLETVLELYTLRANTVLVTLRG
jgi:hypothetical protein